MLEGTREQPKTCHAHRSPHLYLFQAAPGREIQSKKCLFLRQGKQRNGTRVGLGCRGTCSANVPWGLAHLPVGTPTCNSWPTFALSERQNMSSHKIRRQCADITGKISDAGSHWTTLLEIQLREFAQNHAGRSSPTHEVTTSHVLLNRRVGVRGKTGEALLHIYDGRRSQFFPGAADTQEASCPHDPEERAF